jgi:hypothetical protein
MSCVHNPFRCHTLLRFQSLKRLRHRRAVCSVESPENAPSSSGTGSANCAPASLPSSYPRSVPIKSVILDVASQLTTGKTISFQKLSSCITIVALPQHHQPRYAFAVVLSGLLERHTIACRKQDRRGDCLSMLRLRLRECMSPSGSAACTSPIKVVSGDSIIIGNHRGAKTSAFKLQMRWQ